MAKKMLIDATHAEETREPNPAVSLPATSISQK